MSSVLDTSVLSTAGRLVGRNCSEIPFQLSKRVLLKRALLWRRMQEKYEQLEENSMNQETISINRLGNCSVKSLSSSCNEVVPLSTYIESPGRSWEHRQKYRKSKDLVQHWINTSLDDSFTECAERTSPVASECQELSSYDSGTESSHISPNTNSCIQEHLRNYEEYDTSRKFLSKDFKNVDIISGTSKEEDTHDGFSEVVFTTQTEEHTFRKRPTRQFLEDCSKIRHTKSERLTADRKSAGTERNNRILLSGDKGTPLSKKIILQNCDKSMILTNREALQAADRACISRRETVVELYKSQTLREKELSSGNIKSTRKQIMENYEKHPTAASDTDTGEYRKSHISGYETPVCSGEEASILQKEISKENVYSLYVRKVSHRNGMLIQDDTRTHREQNKQNSGTKEKPTSCYGREKIFKKCDTDPTLRRDTFLFSGKKVSISTRKENETMRRTRMLFSDSETSTSEDTRNAEKYNKSPVSWKEEPVPSVSNTLVSGAKTYVENFYTRPFERTEDALLPRTEVNLGYSDGGQILRKNKLPTVDKQTLLSTLQAKLLTEAEESTDCVTVQVLESGEKNENSGVGLSVAEEEERIPVVGQECHIKNPVSISKQLCEQNAALKPAESCTEVDRRENLALEVVVLPTSDEDCVEESLEDASTVIIHPLLSCRSEYAVPKIRKKLTNLREILNDEDRSPMVIHDEKRPSCSSERTGLQHKRKSMFTEGKNKRCKLSLDIKQLSHVSETLSQTEDAKYYEHLGSGDDSVLPIIVSDEQEDTRDTKNENRTKNAFQRTSLQSEEEEGTINNGCSKIFSSGLQTVSRRNDSINESPECLVTSLEFGTKKIKYNHCNFDDESHNLKMDSKRGRETSVSISAVGSVHDGNESETTDDDIFYYRCPQNSLSCEKEKQTNKETVRLDSQNKFARSASAKISELQVASMHCSNDRRVFSDNSDQRVTETPHFVIGSGHKRTEDNATGDGKNAGRKGMLTRTKRKTRSSHNLVRSKRDEIGHASNDSKSLKQENVLTTSTRRATALKNLVGSKHEENGYDISDDSKDQRNGNILHRRRRSDPSYRLIASDHDKSESYVSDDGELLNMENVLTRLKRQMKSSNSSVGSKHNITEDVSGDGETPNKESVPSGRKNRTKICSSSDGSKCDQNGGHIADDGPEKENVLQRREIGRETYHLIASGYDKSDDILFVSDSYTSKNESIFITGEITGMPKHHGYDSFYTPHKRPLLCKKEKRKTNNSSNTSLKSSRSNNYKSVMNNSSQNMLTRNNVPRKSLKHSVKSMVRRNENTVNGDNSSEEKSPGIDFLTDSHRQQFSGDIMQKINSSQESDGNIHKTDCKLTKNSRTNTRRVSLIESETEEEMGDDIFYKTPRRSLLCEKDMGRTSSICGNETLTCLKSNKTNKNNSSQNLTSRNNISRESHASSFNSLVFKKENTGDKGSAGIEGILTDFYRQQFSRDVMEEIGSSCNKSGGVHKTDMESSLMKSSRRETQKDISASLEHLEEKLLQYEEDIFCYRTPKQSLPCRKEKNRQFQYS